MILVALDPGIKCPAAAVFKDRQLYRVCWLPKPKGREERTWFDAARGINREQAGGGVDLFVFERPQIYQAHRTANDANDLVDLALMTGALGAMLNAENNEGIYPHVWKGNLPKDVCAKRVLMRLTPSEHATLARFNVPKSLAHNVHDAIGIGLYALGRFGPLSEK